MRVLAVGFLTLAVLVGVSLCQYPNYYGGGAARGGGSNYGFFALIGLIFIIMILFGGNNQARDVHVMYGNYTNDAYTIGK